MLKNNFGKIMKNSNFINPHFDLIRLSIQENIGKFIVGLLVLTYLATGAIIGLALQKGLVPFGPVISWFAGMGLAVIGQMIRGSLVYFGQSNPYRLGGSAHLMGTMAALALTVYACYEVISLLSEQGITQAVQISVVGFIVAGFFVEYFFLRELLKINQYVLVNDPALYQQALANERKLAEIKIKTTEASIALMHARRQRMGYALAHAEEAEIQEAQPLPELPQSQALPQAEKEAPTLSAAVLNAIGKAYKLSPAQTADIVRAVKQGREEALILEMVEIFSAMNSKQPPPPSPQEETAQYSPNGKGGLGN